MKSHADNVQSKCVNEKFAVTLQVSRYGRRSGAPTTDGRNHSHLSTEGLGHKSLKRRTSSRLTRCLSQPTSLNGTVEQT